MDSSTQVIAVILILVILFCAYRMTRFTYIGNYWDAFDRVLLVNEDKGNPFLDGNYKTRSDVINKCYNVAKEKGDKYFAIQDGGFCSSSNSEDYAKLGPAPVKDLTNKYLGGPWNNAVYKVNR